MLRVSDRDRDREVRYKNELMKKVETYACAEEPEGNESNYHYHSVHQKQKSTLHDRLVKYLWTGSQHAFSHFYADTEEHWRRSLCYISKGPKRGEYPKIIINDFNFSEEQIWEMHYEWWDKWVNFKIKQIKQEAKDRNKFNLMYNAIPIQAFIDGPWAIAEEIIQFYQDNDSLEPNDFQLKCYVKSLIRKHVAERSSDNNWKRFKTQRAKEIIGGEFRYEHSLMNVDESKMRVGGVSGEARSDKNEEDPDTDELEIKIISLSQEKKFLFIEE